MATSRKNRFQQLQDIGQLVEVKMDSAAILLPGKPIAIGTQNLNGYTGIAVLGRAIILAHIAPLPPHLLGASSSREIHPDEGDKHFERLVDAVQTLHKNNSSLFPAQTSVWGNFGRFRDEVAMPDKVEIAKQRFSKLGLPMKPAFYDVQAASLHASSAGTVVGFIKDGKTHLLVEDKPVHAIDFSVETRVPALASASSSRRANPATTTVTRQRPDTHGTWLYSSQQRRWAFQLQDGTRPPHQQWPAASGKQRVWLVEKRNWRLYDFSTKSWCEDNNDDDDDDSGEDDDDGGDEDDDGD